MGILGYDEPSLSVQMVKQQLGIAHPNDQMTDDEIAAVCRWFGEHAPDTLYIDGKPTLGRRGIDVMLSIAINEFPEFYERHGLAQFN